MRTRPLAIIAAIAALLASTESVSASAEHFNPPKQYYLALGDSLAYGFQLGKALSQLPTLDATTFDTGYVDDFAVMMRAVRPDLQVVNFGCPGETTAS